MVRGPDSHLPKVEVNSLPGWGPSTGVITEGYQDSPQSRDLPISERRNSEPSKDFVKNTQQDNLIPTAL